MSGISSKTSVIREFLDLCDTAQALGYTVRVNSKLCVVDDTGARFDKRPIDAPGDVSEELFSSSEMRDVKNFLSGISHQRSRV